MAWVVGRMHDASNMHASKGSEKQVRCKSTDQRTAVPSKGCNPPAIPSAVSVADAHCSARPNACDATISTDSVATMTVGRTSSHSFKALATKVACWPFSLAPAPSSEVSAAARASCALRSASSMLTSGASVAAAAGAPSGLLLSSPVLVAGARRPLLPLLLLLLFVGV